MSFVRALLILLMLSTSVAIADDPKENYLRYLSCIESMDEPGALAVCLHGSEPDSSETLFTRYAIAQLAFNAKLRQQFGMSADKLVRRDFDIAAIHATQERLKKAKAEYRGDKAYVQVPWKEDDSSDVDVFMYSNGPLLFDRDQQGKWKLNLSSGAEKSDGRTTASMKTGIESLNHSLKVLSTNKFKTVDQYLLYLKEEKSKK